MLRPALVVFLCAFALSSASPDAAAQTCPKTDQCCGNGICDPDELEYCPEDCRPRCDDDGQCEAGEDQWNCASDCPPPCEPDGCGGRCGTVSDGCGGQIDCGSCAPPCPNPNGVCELHLGEDPDSCPDECDDRCGNNVCQPGEPTRCPTDCPPPPPCPGACAAGCPALPSFDMSATTIMTGQLLTLTAHSGSIADPTPEWDFGDGQHCHDCAHTVQHAYASPGTYAIRLTAVENVCYSPAVSHPRYVTVEQGPPPCPSPNGVCEPELGEEPTNCPVECDEECGNARCQQGEPARCPSDCPSPCHSETWCDAGCAAVPSFLVSEPKPVVQEEVTFHAYPDTIIGSTVNWDFGDAQHCEGCGLDVSHAYDRPGTYTARLTATENVCGSTQVSFPRYLTVSDRAVVRGDGAVVAAQDLPTTLTCGTAYEASVTMRNIGTTTWTAAEGYKLGAVGDEDPLTSDIRVPLPDGVAIPPFATYTFTFTLQTSRRIDNAVTDWRMLREGVAWFGATASSPISASAPSCGAPVPGASYHCSAETTDGYGRPWAGVPIALTLFRRERIGDPEERTELIEIDRRVQVTEADGRTMITAPTDVPIHYMECAVDLAAMPEAERKHWRRTRTSAGRDRTDGDDTVAAGHVLTLSARRAPVPDYVHSVPGRYTGERQGVARLYLGKDRIYDKVVMIPEGMDFREQDDNARREEPQLWFLFDRITVTLYNLGYDVWLFEPTATADNIHEQAAEFAQAIDYAAGHAGGPPGGKVIVAGYSLGGIVARIATARWGQDAAWRAQLNLSDHLPVSLVAFGDAPLRGAVASVELQRWLWEKDAAGMLNLDSCAAQQLLKTACLRGSQQDVVCSSYNWQAFYERGTPIAMNWGSCEAGPAVFQLGFAPVPTIGFSAGTWTPDRIQCYGTSAGTPNDFNSDRVDLCRDDPGGHGPWVPSPGDVFLEVDALCPWGLEDKVFRASAEDLVAGSRFSTPLKGYMGGLEPSPTLSWLFAGLFCQGTGDVVLHQQFAPTFIPITSALAADEPSQVPFDWRQNTYHAPHDSPSPALINFLLKAFANATGGGMNAPPTAVISGPATAPAAAEVTFDGSASADADGAVESQLWALGDGAMALGPTAAHAFVTPGVYHVDLTVTDDRGATATASTTIAIGDLPPDNTAAGQAVEVRVGGTQGDAPVVVMFSAVTESGNTWLAAPAGVPPPPDGYTGLEPPLAYEIRSSARLAGTAGSVQVCFDLTGWNLGANGRHFENGGWLSVFRRDGGGAWSDVTSHRDGAARRICGAAEGVGLFAVFERIQADARPVVWTDEVAVAQSGAVLQKIRSTDQWDSGAVSVLAIGSGDGYAEVTATELGTFRMFGLTGDHDGPSYDDIDHAFYLLADGSLHVFERGVFRAAVGSYATGDRLRVAVEAGQVTYRRNTWLLHTSAVPPRYPLRVDAAFLSPAATLSAAVVSGRLETVRDVEWVDTAGARVNVHRLVKARETWDWDAGGVSRHAIQYGDGYVQVTASEASSYRMVGLGHLDSGASYEDIEYAFYLVAWGDLQVWERGQYRLTVGTWQTGDRLRVSVTDGLVSYLKNGALLYTSTLPPRYPLRADASLYSPGATVRDVMISGRLCVCDDVAWTRTAGVALEDGTLRKSAGDAAWTAGAASASALVSRNGGVRLVASETTTHRMIGLGDGAAAVTDPAGIAYALVLDGRGELHVFESGARRASAGRYATGDQLSVTAAGGTVSYWRNGLRLHTSQVPPRYPLRVLAALFDPDATLEAVTMHGDRVRGEAVTWTNVVGAAAAGNNLAKTAPTDWWDAGASSTLGISSAAGALEFRADATRTYRMIGLAADDAHPGYADIDYAFYLHAWGDLEVYENGTFRAHAGTFLPGDRLRVSVDAGVVRYWKNGIVVYTSATPAAYPLRVDAALLNPGAALESVFLEGSLVPVD